MKKRVTRSRIVTEGDVDLTPLIDCVFLLLIFFMVTTVFIEVQGLVVDLPSASENQEEQQQQKKDVNVLVTSTGEYRVAGTPVSQAGLGAAIKGAMDESKNENVIIQGDPDSPHKAVVYAMDMATTMGAKQLAFAIEEQEGEQ